VSAPPLVLHPWIGCAAALGGFALLYGVLRLASRRTGIRPEVTRKLLHAGSGALTLPFPFLFHDLRPVLLLTASSAAFVFAIKSAPTLRARFGGVADRVERSTLGELYFPISVALLFALTRGRHPLLFVIPILMLTLADATSALVGGRYGLTRYIGNDKSLEGSIAFVVVAFFCVHVPLLLWSDVGRAESLLIAATLALLAMLLEGSAWRGLDNLFVPIGGYFLLRADVTLDAGSLVARFVVTVLLVVAVVATRQRTTLEDDSLVAGAFMCYVAWALMGWRWLVPPIAIFAGYAWVSPPTPENSRRIHEVPAVLSVWAAAVGWLALAHLTGRAAMLLPYTIVFATHLAMFGISRLASQFPERAIAPLFGRAVITSWIVVMMPFLATSGVTPGSVAGAAVGAGAIALGTIAFTRLQPEIRDVPLTRRRWTCQAGAAAAASLAAWTALLVLTGTPS
jgi:phytol kinase